MNLLYRAIQTKLPPFESACVNKLLDSVKGKVTAKVDCLKVVSVPASPSVRADDFPTVGTKW